MKNDKDLKLIAPNFKMGKVNLDALIPREDLEIKDDSITDSSEKSEKIKISELEERGTFHSLRS